MKRIIMTIIKSLAIIIGLLLGLQAITQFGENTGYSGAYQSGSIVGTIMLLIVGIALIVLPTISIYRSFISTGQQNNEPDNHQED